MSGGKYKALITNRYSGICIHNYHITSGSVLLSEPEKKIQETPFKLCSLLFQILYTCPKNFIEAASQNIREK